MVTFLNIQKFDFSHKPMENPPPQLRQPEQVCGTRKNGASRLLNCTYILHRKLEKVDEQNENLLTNS